MTHKNKFLKFILIVVPILLIYLVMDQILVRTLNLSNHIKSYVLDKKISIDDIVNRHFNQVQTIQRLQEQIKELEPKASLSVAFASQLNALLHDFNMSNYDPELKLVKVLSYVELNNQNRVYLEFPNFDEDKQYGLIYKGMVAGVIKSKASQPIGIFLSDKDAIFSVLIGEDSIEGVAFGNGKNIKIKYIPTYKNPKIGDEVITSGYDKLFYHGIKVGKVVKIEKTPMYKIATLKPYCSPKKPKFLYAVDIK